MPWAEPRSRFTLLFERFAIDAEAPDPRAHIALDANTGQPLRRLWIVRDEQERIGFGAQHTRDAIDHARAVHALESLGTSAVARCLPAGQDHARARHGHVW